MPQQINLYNPAFEASDFFGNPRIVVARRHFPSQSLCVGLGGRDLPRQFTLLLFN